MTPEETRAADTGKLVLYFGAVADSLVTQIKAAGIKVSHDEMEHFQKDADAISRLAVRDLLRESEKNRMQTALFKRIIKHLETR